MPTGPRALHARPTSIDHGASPASPASPAPPGRSLKSRALQWLAQREHSRAELRGKLVAHAQRSEQRRPTAASARAATAEADADPPTAAAQRTTDPAVLAAAIDALLDWLEAQRFLCDERFVESRVHARIDRFGNARIRLELAQHRVALSPDAERRLRESELERARALWSRKYAGTATDPASRARQSRFLAGRGFGAEVIARVLREAARAADGTPGQSGED